MVVRGADKVTKTWISRPKQHINRGIREPPTAGTGPREGPAPLDGPHGIGRRECLASEPASPKRPGKLERMFRAEKCSDMHRRLRHTARITAQTRRSTDNLDTTLEYGPGGGGRCGLWAPAPCVTRNPTGTAILANFGSVAARRCHRLPHLQCTAA